MSKNYHYNKTEVFNNQIKPVLKQAFELCKENGIPLILVAQHAAGEDGDRVYTLRASQPDWFMSPPIVAMMFLEHVMDQANSGDSEAALELMTNPIWRSAVDYYRQIIAEQDAAAAAAQ